MQREDDSEPLCLIRGGRGDRSQTTAEQEADDGHRLKIEKPATESEASASGKGGLPPKTAQLGNELTKAKQLGPEENVERAETETEQIVAIWGRCGEEKESGAS